MVNIDNLTLSQIEVLTILNLVGIIFLATWVYAKEILPLKNKKVKNKKEINSLSSESTSGKTSDDSHWEVGKNYFIRTVTMIQCGKLEKVTDKELILSSASWIADTGRFSESLATGKFEEIEIFPSKNTVIVNRSALIDATVYNHKLPTKSLP